jgi:predicted 2-oxoglutarate/Fe(II)-dependent dioxygenase YbiX
MVIFTKEECEYIKSFYYTEKESSSNDVQHYGDVSIKFSNSSAKFISTTNKELIEFLLNKLKPYGIKSIPMVKFMRYQTGDSLARHTDFDKYGVDKIYKTFLIQMSNSEDYVGGDLIVGKDVQSREQGWLSIINPTTPHEVTKMISGERISLVLFLSGENLDLKKSLI